MPGFYAEDDEAGMRAAHHLDARRARDRQGALRGHQQVVGNAKALLDAVPAAARNDPGYMFSRIQWLRRADKIAEAAHAAAGGAARAGAAASIPTNGGSSGG